MNNRFHTLIASLLLAAFSAYLVPKEMVHELYGHEDTHESSCPTSGNAISEQHTHCDFLSYEASLFTVSSVSKCPGFFEHEFAFISKESEHSAVNYSDFPSLRGPPLS